MAVPKRKTSSTKRNKRRSHLALSTPNLSSCSQCGADKLPHRACGECGTYKGEDRLPTSD